MHNVLPFPNTKPSAVYVVEVIHDEDMWVGSCDALHCCTEAPSVRIDFVQATAIAPEALLQA